MSSASVIATATPGLVPELLVTDLAMSVDFWVRLCGFETLYDRPEEGFACIHSGSAHIMLEQIGAGRNWIPGALERPLGRGVNFEVRVPAIAPVLERLSVAHWPLFMAPETKWYSIRDTEVGVSQFLVQDPDGYLVRFAAPINVDTDGDQGHADPAWGSFAGADANHEEQHAQE